MQRLVIILAIAVTAVTVGAVGWILFVSRRGAVAPKPPTMRVVFPRPIIIVGKVEKVTLDHVTPPRRFHHTPAGTPGTPPPSPELPVNSAQVNYRVLLLGATARSYPPGMSVEVVGFRSWLGGTSNTDIPDTRTIPATEVPAISHMSAQIGLGSDIPAFRRGQYFVMRVLMDGTHRRLWYANWQPVYAEAKLLPLGIPDTCGLAKAEAKHLAVALNTLHVAGPETATRPVRAGRMDRWFLPMPPTQAQGLLRGNANFFSWAYAVWSLAQYGRADVLRLFSMLRRKGAAEVGRPARGLISQRRANWIVWCVANSPDATTGLRKRILAAYLNYIYDKMTAASP